MTMLPEPNLTGFLLSFPVGIVMGRLGWHAGLPFWLNGVVGIIVAFAVWKLCTMMGLP
jgi:hypothetical protein